MIPGGYRDKKRRHKVFNFQILKLDIKIINENFKEVFNKQKPTFLCDFFSGTWKPVKIHTAVRTKTKPCLRSHNCCLIKLIAIQVKVVKFDSVEQCTQERQNNKWRFKLIISVFLLHYWKMSQWDIQTLCYPQHLLKKHSVNCLLSKDHLCLFRALTMYLLAHSYLDAHKSQLFTEFILARNRRTFVELPLMIYLLYRKKLNTTYSLSLSILTFKKENRLQNQPGEVLKTLIKQSNC